METCPDIAHPKPDTAIWDYQVTPLWAPLLDPRKLVALAEERTTQVSKRSKQRQTLIFFLSCLVAFFCLISYIIQLKTFGYARTRTDPRHAPVKLAVNNSALRPGTAFKPRPRSMFMRTRCSEAVLAEHSPTNPGNCLLTSDYGEFKHVYF